MPRSPHRAQGGGEVGQAARHLVGVGHQPVDQGPLDPQPGRDGRSDDRPAQLGLGHRPDQDGVGGDQAGQLGVLGAPAVEVRPQRQHDPAGAARWRPWLDELGPGGTVERGEGLLELVHHQQDRAVRRGLVGQLGRAGFAGAAGWLRGSATTASPAAAGKSASSGSSSRASPGSSVSARSTSSSARDLPTTSAGVEHDRAPLGGVRQTPPRSAGSSPASTSRRGARTHVADDGEQPGADQPRDQFGHQLLAAVEHLGVVGPSVTRPRYGSGTGGWAAARSGRAWARTWARSCTPAMTSSRRKASRRTGSAASATARSMRRPARPNAHSLAARCTLRRHAARVDHRGRGGGVGRARRVDPHDLGDRLVVERAQDQLG